MKGAGHGGDKGSGSAVRSVKYLPYSCVEDHLGGSPQLQGGTEYSKVSTFLADQRLGRRVDRGGSREPRTIIAGEGMGVRLTGTGGSAMRVKGANRGASTRAQGSKWGVNRTIFELSLIRGGFKLRELKIW